MTRPDGQRWRVELSRRAAEQWRSADPVTRRALAQLIDTLEEGIPEHARRDDEADVWSWGRGDHRDLRFVVRPDDRTIVVFRIEGGEPSRSTPLRSPTWDRAASWMWDLRYALRGLRRAPAFTTGIVLTLALGLGGASTIFGLVHTVFRGALPFEDGDRVVRVRSRSVSANGDPFLFNVTPRDFELIRGGHRSFVDVVAQAGGSISLIGDGPAERASTIGVSRGWTGLLGVEPIVGRGFTSEEEAQGSEAGVALVSHALWQRRFGSDPEAVGRDLAYDGGSFRIVGVMPPRFAYPYDADLWVPWRADPSDWTSSSLNVVARLAPGVELAAAQADVDALYADVKRASPGTAPNRGFGVTTSRDDFIRSQAAALQSLAVAVMFLLLLVCVNVANLFVARTAALRRELAVRAALGAGHARLLRSAVLESIVVFLAGGAVGLLLVRPLGAAAAVLIPDVLRTQLDVATVSAEPQVVGFALVVAVAAGVLTGLFGARSGGRVDLQSVLRDGRRGSSVEAGRLRDALVVSELSLSLVLLVGAGVLADHFQRLQSADLGFRTSDVTTAQLSLQHERYETPEARVRLYDELRAALTRSGRVTSVGMTSVNPLCCGDWGARIRIEGVERPPDAPPITIHHRYVTRDYFGTLDVPIVQGRGFGLEDAIDTPPSVIIDEDLAARFWPGESAIGRRIAMDREGAPWRTVVGVAARAHTEGDQRETWYLPFEQEPTGRSNEIVHLMVRGDGLDAAAVRAAVASVDPGLAVFGVSGLDGLREERLAQDRVGAVVAATFALAGLLLAAVGLYGLLAYQVELQRTELGTRVALGAGRAAIGSWVFGRTARLVAVGLLVGLVVARGVSEAVVRLVEGARLAPVGLLAVLCGVLVLTASIATVVPTLRALASDPAAILKGD